MVGRCEGKKRFGSRADALHYVIDCCRGKQVDARYRRREGEFHARRRGIAEQTCCEHKYSDKLDRTTKK